MQRAVFISRTGAYLAAGAAAAKRGISDEIANLHCRAYPVFKRGQLMGWEAWFPTHPTQINPNPVMEA